MHARRYGRTMVLEPTLETLAADTAFAESLGCDITDKRKGWRIKYDEATLKKVAAYIKIQQIGSLDDTLQAFAERADAWAKTTPELTLPSKRLQMKHQKQGDTLLSQYGRFMLGFDMGTGKSKTVVDMACELFRTDKALNCLIVTDATVTGTWVTELIEEDCDEQIIALTGSRIERVSKLQYGLAKGYRFLVINYDGFPVLLKEILAEFGPRTILVLDESQRVKNHTTNRFKSVWNWFLYANPTYVWELSGTPISQAPEDVFGQYALLDHTIFGHPKKGWYGFKATYTMANPNEPRHIVGYKHMDTFMDKFHSRCFRVRTEDVIDLPPKRYVPVYLDLPSELRKVYDDFAPANKSDTRGVLRIPGHPATIEGLDCIYTASHAFTVMQKAQQIANNYIYLTDEESGERQAVTLFEEAPDPKIDFILQLLEDTDQPIIIWFVYHGVGKRIAAALGKAGYSFVVVDGSTKIGEQRTELLNRFRTGQARILVAQSSTVNTGVNSLTHCHINVYYENSYRTDHRRQGEKRTHRLGMDTSIESVLYYDLLYDKTVEVYIYNTLRRNIALSATLVDSENLDKILNGTWML